MGLRGVESTHKRLSRPITMKLVHTDLRAKDQIMVSTLTHMIKAEQEREGPMVMHMIEPVFRQGVWVSIVSSPQLTDIIAPIECSLKVLGNVETELLLTDELCAIFT
jgi:hypothetical protein